jgi:hypothetical protein
MPQFIGRSGSEEMQQGLGMLQQGMSALGAQFEAMRMEEKGNWEDLLKQQLALTQTGSIRELATQNPSFLTKYLQKTKGMDPAAATVFTDGIAKTTQYKSEDLDRLFGLTLRTYGMEGGEAGSGTPAQTVAGTGTPSGVPMQDVNLKKTGAETAPEASMAAPAVPSMQPQDIPTLSFKPGEAAQGTPAATTQTKKVERAWFENPETQAWTIWKAAGGLAEPSEKDRLAMESSWKAGLSEAQRRYYVGSGVNIDEKAKKIFSEAPAIWKRYYYNDKPAATALYEDVEVPVESAPAPPVKEEAVPGSERLAPKTAVTETPKKSETGVSPVSVPAQAGPAATPAFRQVALNPGTPGVGEFPEYAQANTGIQTEQRPFQVAAAAVGEGVDVQRNKRVAQRYLAEENAAAVAEINKNLGPNAMRQFYRTQLAMREDPLWIQALATTGDANAMKILEARGAEEQRALETKRIDAQNKALDAQIKQLEISNAQATKNAEIENMKLELERDKLALEKELAGPQAAAKKEELEYQKWEMNTRKEMLVLQLQAETRKAAATAGDAQMQTLDRLATPVEATMKEADNAITTALNKSMYTTDSKGNTKAVTDPASVKNIVNNLNIYVEQYNKAVANLNGIYGQQIYSPRAPFTAAIVTGWFGREKSAAIAGGTVGTGAPAAATAPGAASSEAAASGLMKAQ